LVTAGLPRPPDGLGADCTVNLRNGLESKAQALRAFAELSTIGVGVVLAAAGHMSLHMHSGSSSGWSHEPTHALGTNNPNFLRPVTGLGFRV